MVLGQRAAEFMAAQLGKPVEIGHSTFQVTGIIRTANGFEDGGVFMPLEAAQDFFHKQDSSSVITIKLRNKSDVPAFKAMMHEAVSEPCRAGGF